ncbi:MAG: alpha/beta hydrolase [Myxococcota bacterium]|nr:alpha/beta hydrolase [Myxococcota bacterium]
MHVLRWGDGPRHIVLLHGFPDNAWSMQIMATRLAHLGHTVWAPFLRGYAPSALAWDGRYDLSVLAADLIELLEVIDARECTLVGHDWGAVIAYAVSALGCERISQVVALSVPPIPIFLRSTLPVSAQLFRSRYMLFFQAGSWADWFIRKRGLRLIDDLWTRWSPSWTPPRDRIEQVKSTLRERGRLEAALSYYRHNVPFLGPHGKATWSLMNKAPQHAVSCLVGTDDRCIHQSLFDSVAYPVSRLQSAGHFLPLEAADAVVDHIINT